MANLKVATEWNSGGTPIAYRRLTDDDFNLAARNIYLIVTCLGNAVMDLYDRDVKAGTHIFKDAWFGDAPFVVVTKSCSKLGKMIANIAKGVSDMVNLSVADQWNDKGEPIHFRNLVENDFILAKKNVKDIVITFANGIMELVANPKYKDFFHTDWFKGESDFAKVIKACTNIGQIISNIADGVVKIAAGTYKKYDDKGKEIGTFAITDKMYLQAANNLSKIVTILIDGCPEDQVLGLAGLGLKYRKIFTDDGSGVKAAVEAVKGVTSFIGQLADTIIKVAGGTYEYTDEKGNKITKHLDDNVIKAATQNVALMMGGLVASVQCIYEAADVNGKIMGPYLSKEDIGIVTKKSFWTQENYENVDYESSPFAAALAAVKGIIDIVGNMADSVLKMAAGEFNGKQVSTDRIDRAGTIVADIIKPLIGGIWSVRLNENTKKDVMTTVDTAIQIFKKFSGIDINKLFENAPKAETKTVINSIMEQMRDIRDLQRGEDGKNLLNFFNQTNYDTFDSQATIFLRYIDRLREVFLKTGIISNIAFTYKSPRMMFDTMMSDIDYIRLQLNDRAQFSFNLTVMEQFNKVLEYTKKITSMNQTKDIKEVRGLICDINKLDSKKVDQFRSIFDAIRSLAKQLGSIDKLATVLSNELNASLTELADKLALAGAQIDKADEYQEKRKDNLMELISSITSILDRPIMVTPAPLELDDSPLGSSPSGSANRLPSSAPPTGSAEGGTDAYSNPGPEGSGYIPPSVAQQSYRPPSSDQTAMLAQALSYLRKMYGMLNS